MPKHGLRRPGGQSIAPAQCHKCAYHTKATWTSPSATPATQQVLQCHQVPCLPCKVPLCQGHACHALAAWMSPGAMPAMDKRCGCHKVPSDVDVTKYHACHAKCRRHSGPRHKRVWEKVVWQSCVWKTCVRECCVWESCVSKTQCLRVVCVCDRVVCDKVERRRRTRATG